MGIRTLTSAFRSTILQLWNNHPAALLLAVGVVFFFHFLVSTTVLYRDLTRIGGADYGSLTANYGQGEEKAVANSVTRGLEHQPGDTLVRSKRFLEMIAIGSAVIGLGYWGVSKWFLPGDHDSFGCQVAVSREIDGWQEKEEKGGGGEGETGREAGWRGPPAGRPSASSSGRATSSARSA